MFAEATHRVSTMEDCCVGDSATGAIKPSETRKAAIEKIRAVNHAALLSLGRNCRTKNPASGRNKTIRRRLICHLPPSPEESAQAESLSSPRWRSCGWCPTACAGGQRQRRECAGCRHQRHRL